MRIPETTMTSTVTNRIQSVLSCCAISSPRGELVDDALERFSAVFEALELVEAGARGRQQNGVSRRCVRVGVRHGGIERARVHKWNRALNLLADLSRGGADQE